MPQGVFLDPYSYSIQNPCDNTRGTQGLDFFRKNRYNSVHQGAPLQGENGGYGIMVITGVCGTLNSGSIPGSRPNENIFIL